MRSLYLVYRVLTDGTRHPETIMGLDGEDFAEAAKALDQMAGDDNPDCILREGERWEFVPQEDASIADWEAIAPPDARSLPY